jgi:DNA polymerase I-like protein with 3'-5' exonuclease and polymerase domains
MISPITGRIHTNFNQLMSTGRLSSGNAKENKPNLQNLPSDEFTRSCFIAEPGNKFIAADYSSQEQIVLANFSLEQNLINFYEKGFTDMHSYVAFLMYPDIRRCTIEELEPDKLTYIKKEHSDKRTLAKSAGFAIKPFYLF